MSKKQMEATIESLSHDGRGVTTLQNKTTFVSGALPTEKVLCEITHSHRRYNEAKVIDVISAAAERIKPHCAHFGICGGCSMQHVEFAAQVQLKQNALLEQLQHFGKIQPEEVLPPIVGNPWGYRRKARLGVRYVIKKEKLLIGFREKFSNYLADIEECPVLHPSVGKSLLNLRQLIRGLTQYQHIPQIEVAVSDQTTALVIRHMTPLSEMDLTALREFARQEHFHIYLQPNPPAPIHKLWPDDQQELLSYFLPDYQLEMRFHPLDFTQVNGEINREMIKQALQLLDPKPTDTILDLFCGLGNFTLPIARFAKHVIGVEGTMAMVERAKANAEYNHIKNTEFYAANLMEPKESMPWLKTAYDKVLIDPPRTGAKEILPYLTNPSIKRLVYVSCNPSTLARDAGELVYNYQYKLKKVGVINMFPHTSHIEAIALFEKT